MEVEAIQVRVSCIHNTHNTSVFFENIQSVNLQPVLCYSYLRFVPYSIEYSLYLPEPRIGFKTGPADLQIVNLPEMADVALDLSETFR